MRDARASRRLHLTPRMVWWALTVIPLLGGATVCARHDFQTAVQLSLVLSLCGVVVLVLAHVCHLARRPGCPRCLHIFDWLALEREAHNAGMDPDDYLELVRPRGPFEVGLPPGLDQTRRPLTAPVARQSRGRESRRPPG